MSRLAKDSSFPSTASSSQEDLENGSSSTSSRKLRVTLLSSEWKSTKGGLSTINRELAIHLAKHPTVEVSVYLPQCTENDKRIAARHNVHLIEAEEMSGYDPVDWLATVPKHHVMDCVIGHGLPLGRQVPHIKRHHNCKWIQVVHTAPEELGMYKSYADTISKGEKKHQVEVKLCELVDQVVAVGPKLAEAFSGYLRSCGKDQDVLNLTPGIFSEFSDVKQATEERRTFCVLVFGRGDNEDFQLKGYDIAAQAIAELKDMSQPYKLVFVGAPSGEEEKVKEMLLEQGIDRSQLTVRCFNESREQLARLFCEVDLAIMPSRTEGFGLAALEALSAGLPVLVSGNSGLGEALKKIPYGSHCVLESEDPNVWAKAIRDVRKKDRKLRLKESKVLCREYAEMYSWQEQCDKLVERMMNISLGNTADEQDLLPKAPAICQTSGYPLHSGSFHKGPEGIHASGKGKRPLSPSATPAPKRRPTDDHEAEQLPCDVNDDDDDDDSGDDDEDGGDYDDNEDDVGNVGSEDITDEQELSQQLHGLQLEGQEEHPKEQDQYKTKIDEEIVTSEGTYWPLKQEAVHLMFPAYAVSEPTTIVVHKLKCSACSPPLQDHEVIVSNVIEISTINGQALEFNAEVKLFLSHSAPDLRGYEMVIKRQINKECNEWEDIDGTQDLRSLSDIRGGCPSPNDIPDFFFPVAQAGITKCSTYAVICRLRSSPLYTITSTGGYFSHPDYPGVTVTIPENAVTPEAKFSLQLKASEEVTRQPVAVKDGNPSSFELEGLSEKLPEQWEKLGRRLNFDDAKLKGYHKDNEEVAKKVYAMLKAWKEREGSDATYRVLYQALCDINRTDLAQDLCCH